MKFIDALLNRVLKIKYNKIDLMLKNPVACQEKLMQEFVFKSKDTLFGKDHSFSEIKNYEDFKRNIPLRNYDEILPYIEKIKDGEADILWPGKPSFLAKTSGTTGRVKYIPVTKESLKNQMKGPQDAAVHYAYQNKKLSFLRGKVILFSDGHFFETINGIPAAPISTIANSLVPGIYKLLRLPPDHINAIPLYEKRIDAIIDVSIPKDVRSIVAMPIWLLVYLRALKKKTGRDFKTHFPNFKVLFLSGMNYEPFLPEIKKYITMPIDLLETYPSTEGFLAYQDQPGERGMQLVLNNGVFFEFVPLDELHKKDSKRISLKDVEPGINYALVLNTNAGLWGYLIGDTLRFKSIFPHRIEITGRISQFVSAFGEHVTTEQVEKAIAETAIECSASIVEFTVAPCIKEGTLPYHEWFIEFGEMPDNMEAFAKLLDKKICERNLSYSDLVKHKAIEKLKITVVPAKGFEKFLQAISKASLQQKVPHLRNDYQLAQQLKDILAV